MSEPINALGDYATLTEDDLVTGEAVALDLPAANLGHRIISGLIDLLVTFALAIALLFAVGVIATGLDEALLRVALIGSVVTLFLVFPSTMETLTRGRSIGKFAMGLRTVRDDAGPISFQHAFVRSLIGVVEIYAFTGGPAFLSMMLSGRGKRLGDYAAGTYVVRERVALRLPPPPPLPFPLITWARSADIAALPPSLALSVRQFLGRAHQLEPASRHVLGQELAGQVSAYVAPAPPRGTPAEAFLSAVLASRRERDLNRLQRENELRRRLTAR